jgi:hypothetical protein
MMDRKTFFYASLVVATGIILLNIPIIYKGFTSNEYAYPPNITGLLLTFFPLGALAIAFYVFKGKRYREFYILLGVILMALFWELNPDPWSTETRAALGLPISNVIIYTFIGTVILLFAYFAMKRGVED